MTGRMQAPMNHIKELEKRNRRNTIVIIAMLVAVIVGVTNIIPFFGPFIGAIPSFFIILLQDPMKSLYFLIFILVLQQIDGNIIGPKILGDSTGVSSFWVLFAILLFGGLFGFMGMLLGVPLFAVIYDIIRRLIRHGLIKNKKESSSLWYKYDLRFNPKRLAYVLIHLYRHFEKYKKYCK